LDRETCGTKGNEINEARLCLMEEDKQERIVGFASVYRTKAFDF
jgi:hypothetical protein